MPTWLLVVTASIPWLPFRWRACTLAVIPMTAMILPAWHHLGHRAYFFGQFGTACLVTVLRRSRVSCHCPACAGVPGGPRLHCLATPSHGRSASVSRGFVVVALSTSSGWFRGVAFIGSAPLAVVLLGEWGRILRRDGGRLTFGLTAIGLIVALLVALFASSFKDGPSWSLTHRIWHGPLAGIAMSNERASQIAAVEAQGRRWVWLAHWVLVFNVLGAYLLVGGRAYTNAVWLHFAPGDGNTVTYYVKRGHHPYITT